jgi:uridine kinase
LRNESFQKLVIFNEQQSKIYDIYFYMNNSKIYILPIIYMLLVFKGYSFKYYSKNLFLTFLCFSFVILTVSGIDLIGWYYWVVPFMAYFYSKNEKYSKEMYILFNLFYILYFAVDSNFINDKVHNLILSCFVMFLFSNIYIVYKYGISEILKSKLMYLPYLVGIGGDSGVGKSTFTNALESLFVKEDILIMRGDDMHKWERGDTNWNQTTHLSPKANLLHHNYLHLEKLKNNNTIERHSYDHGTGKFTEKQLLKPRRTILFEGLHPFYIKKNRELYDLKIYMEPEEELRLHWKITRDMEKRGYTKEKVLEQLEKRSKDSKKYIKIQEKHSDITVKYYNINKFKDIGNINEEVELGLEVRLDNTINIEFLIEHLLENENINIVHEYFEDDQTIRFQGEVSKNSLKELSSVSFKDEIEDLEININHIQGGYQGILQVIAFIFIFNNSLKRR